MMLHGLLLAAVGVVAASSADICGPFPILSVPYEEDGSLDVETLVREARHVASCGVAGFIWAQSNDAVDLLTVEEKKTSFTALAKAFAGSPVYVTLGCQGRDTADMEALARHVEDLAVAYPTTRLLIACRPPLDARTQDDLERYYRRLATIARRPVIIQTYAADNVPNPSSELLLRLARERPDIFGWIKEETGEADADTRMKVECAAPEVKTVFSAWGSWGWLRQHRTFGTRGVISERAAYAAELMEIWRALNAKDDARADAIWKAYVNMLLLKKILPGGEHRNFSLHVLNRQGVFKNMISREYVDEKKTPGKWKLSTRTFTDSEIAEIEKRWKELREAAAPPCNVSSGAREIVLESGLPLLFADDSVLVKQSGVSRIVHPARRDEEPVLRPDPSRDGERIYVYGSVWPETNEGRWRLWYGAGSKVCLASSANGVAWTRERQTVVAKGFHSPSVIVDRFETDPARRYKLVGSQFHNGADGKVDRERTGYYTACSPDGIHWSEPRLIMKGWWDTVTMAQDPRSGEILVYHKRQTDWRGFPSCRIVYLIKSMDFENWSEPKLVFAPDEADNQGWIDSPDQRMEIYNFSVLPHAGGFLAFPTMFHVTRMIPHPVKDQAAADGYVDVQIATSSDGTNWSRTPGRRVILPLGHPGSFDGGTILGISNSALTSGGETMMYYTAMTTSHSGVVPEKKFSIGRATWRRHGWVSLAAKGAGSFVTVPLRVAAPRVLVNFRTFSPKGSVRIAVLDVAGRPVAASLPLTGDDTRKVVVWEKGVRPSFSEPVSLRFDLNRAEIYAVECDEEVL